MGEVAMGEVKRWNRGGRLFRGAMVEVGDGDWVEYSDYATLEARSEALEKERDALKAEVEKLRDAVSWHRCSTHGDVDPTAWGCPECVRELRAEVALRKSEVELFRDKLKARCDEVAKLKAACAVKDAALRAAITFIRDRVPRGTDEHNAVAALNAALSDDAGRNWIDASGAVESEAKAAEWGADVEVYATVPDDWAGSKVKIVQVKP